MTEFDFRPECENCRGTGCVKTNCPPNGAQILDIGRGGIFVVCYKCEGSGRGPYTETVELEERS